MPDWHSRASNIFLWEYRKSGSRLKTNTAIIRLKTNELLNLLTFVPRAFFLFKCKGVGLCLNFINHVIELVYCL